MWCNTSLIPALKSKRQMDLYEFKPSLINTAISGIVKATRRKWRRDSGSRSSRSRKRKGRKMRSGNVCSSMEEHFA